MMKRKKIEEEVVNDAIYRDEKVVIKSGLE